MRLIDADALTAKLEEVGQYLNNPAFQLACIAAINELKNAPTIEAVPVIRCKDCKYHRTSVYAFRENRWEVNYCGLLDEKDFLGDSEDDFCSNAVRKEE